MVGGNESEILKKYFAFRKSISGNLLMFYLHIIIIIIVYSFGCQAHFSSLDIFFFCWADHIFARISDFRLPLILLFSFSSSKWSVREFQFQFVLFIVIELQCWFIGVWLQKERAENDLSVDPKKKKQQILMFNWKVIMIHMSCRRIQTQVSIDVFRH